MDINKLHKDSDEIHNLNSFDRDGKLKDTDDIYDPSGFDINKLHKDTKNKYNPNVFDKDGFYKDADDIYDPNGFNRDR